MKILSDFDGVWTKQGLEARIAFETFVGECARLAGVPADEATADFDGYVDELAATPALHGWRPDGERITAYSDEDPLCLTSGVASVIGRSSADRALAYRDAVLGAGHAHLPAFADHVFGLSMARVRAEHPPSIVPEAAEAVARFTELEVELVIASNSPVEKIVDWFAAAGVAVGPDTPVRVHGRAGKEALGPSDARLEVAGRDVVIDRPAYRTLIAEEAPDLVIGDVFSLDLALPHAMRNEGHSAAPRELVLHRHPHTPDWITETRADGAIDHFVDGILELTALAQRLSVSR